MTEATISLVDANSLLSLFGARDQHIKKIREALRVEITHRDGQIRVAGPDQAVAQATEALEKETMVALEIDSDDFCSAILALANVAWCKPRGNNYEVGAEFWWIGWRDDQAQSADKFKPITSFNKVAVSSVVKRRSSARISII